MISKQASLIENDDNEENIECIKGTIDRIIFSNAENGYAIIKLQANSKHEDATTVVGTIPSPRIGGFYAFKGEWIRHPKFGKQFSFSFYEEQLPESLDGIKMFLASGVIKGIGKKRAENIVEHFGLDTFNILDNEPEKILEVAGITKKVVESVKNSWAEQQGIRELMVFLSPHGIGPALSVRLYKQYGADAIEIIKENPYRMAMEVRGVGFLTADQFALSLGFDEDSPLRAQAAAFYILTKEADNGHVYLPKDELIRLTVKQLAIDEAIVSYAIKYLERGEHVVSEYFEEHTAIYLSDYHHFETQISFYLGRLLATPKQVFFKDVDKDVAEIIKAFPVKLAESQEEAVYTAAKSKMMILTGGPGTGKTTIINAIIKVFQKAKAKILLAAPTGRAAKRMSETTGLESKTLHRLLEYNPNENGFARNENNSLQCSLLIIDEASMIDIYLMYSLIKAIPQTCTVIFVGDINQLPSVGAGNVLRDCIYSNKIPVVELTQIFRQAEKSDIIKNAHRINQGIVPNLMVDKQTETDFYFVSEADAQKAADIIVELTSKRLPKKYAFDPFLDIQVLSPMIRGTCGVLNLNRQLQANLNQEGDFLQKDDKILRVNDKVMQIKNNYDKDVYNGDIGIISDVDLEEKSILVRYEDRYIPYLIEEFDELTLAYAISIHKSQGGEYPCVIVPLLNEHYIMLQRNLIYTAVTRGKKLVIIVGTPKALRMAIANNTIHKRFTKLAERLALAQEV